MTHKYPNATRGEYKCKPMPRAPTVSKILLWKTSHSAFVGGYRRTRERKTDRAGERESLVKKRDSVLLLTHLSIYPLSHHYRHHLYSITRFSDSCPETLFRKIQKYLFLVGPHFTPYASSCHETGLVVWKRRHGILLYTPRRHT